MREVVQQIAERFGVSETKVCQSIVDVIDHAARRGKCPGFTRVAGRIIASESLQGFHNIVAGLRKASWQIGKREIEAIESFQM